MSPARSEPWGPSGTVLHEISTATTDSQQRSIIMQVLYERLKEPAANWKKVPPPPGLDNFPGLACLFTPLTLAWTVRRGLSWLQRNAPESSRSSVGPLCESRTVLRRGVCFVDV